MIKFAAQDFGNLPNDFSALGRSDFLPAELRRHDRHLRARVLAHDAVFDRLDRRAAPIDIELTGLCFFHLGMDHDVEIDLLALVALNFD